MTAWKITARHTKTGETREGWSGKLSRQAAEAEALRTLGPDWKIVDARTEVYRP